jgi:hypothetical protein
VDIGKSSGWLGLFADEYVLLAKTTDEGGIPLQGSGVLKIVLPRICKKSKGA